ncbi:MAG TPA: hypothetical protein VGL43_04985, partial [Casimicrobiaceae bacterium]
MPDIPLLLVALTITAYWLRVGAMVVRARHKQRHDVGVVPERASERAMWLLFVPVVAAWCALPWLALGRSSGPLAVPAFARESFAYPGVRWLFAAVAVACLAVTI